MRIAVISDIDGNLPALHAVPYDWTAQARLAAQRGRPDWAHALTTGRMPPGERVIN